MSKIDNKAEYYFGNKPVIEKGADENEFEGSFTESVDLEKLGLIREQNLANFWEQIWIELAMLRCGIEVNDNSDTITLTEVSPIARQRYPYGGTQQQIWSENVTGARKKGWDWSGDTEIYAKTLNGPKNLFEAVISLMISEYSGFWIYRDLMTIEPGDHSAYQDWQSFWNDSCHSYEHDLPAWKGKPERDVVMKQDGNTGIHLAQKSGGTYVVVYYHTS